LINAGHPTPLALLCIEQDGAGDTPTAHAAAS